MTQRGVRGPSNRLVGDLRRSRQERPRRYSLGQFNLPGGAEQERYNSAERTRLPSLPRRTAGTERRVPSNVPDQFADCFRM